MRQISATGGVLLVVFLWGCGSPTRDQLQANKELVRQFGATIDAEDWNALDALVTEDIRRHSRATTDRPEISSREAFKQLEADYHVAFPDGTVTYEMMVAEGNMVAAYATFRGTNTGPAGELPPTNKPVEIPFLAMFRIEGGKIAEIWVEWDNLARLTQLGLYPPSGAAEGD